MRDKQKKQIVGRAPSVPLETEKGVGPMSIGKLCRWQLESEVAELRGLLKGQEAFRQELMQILRETLAENEKLRK